jgi:peptide/nickel transport system permease protein
MQYISFMGGLVQGDFGYSYAKSLKVRDIYLERLPNSLKLGFGAFIISLALGIPLGMLSAIKVNTSWDSVGKVVALLGLSLPGFFVGLVLIIIGAFLPETWDYIRDRREKKTVIPKAAESQSL